MKFTEFSKYYTSIDDIYGIDPLDKEKILEVSNWFSFRASDYYLSLIDWDDPADPIRRLIIPSPEELREWGDLNPSSEDLYTVAPGLQHKYRETALLLISEMCGGFCRYCFRKRLFVQDEDEVVRDISDAVAYIEAHPEISNVLLTGGDPLTLSTSILEDVLRRLCTIDHVRIIRIGSKIPAFLPMRITGDEELLQMLRTYSTSHRQIYLMAQFTHPRELTLEAREAIAALKTAGVVIMNQTPLIRGINDDPETIAVLLNELAYMGVHPYYLFQCRPSKGNLTYTIPVEESLKIFRDGIAKCSGLARRVRFVMSHGTGKIEILGIFAGRTWFRYHQAADPENIGAIFSCPSDPKAYWLEDYLND